MSRITNPLQSPRFEDADKTHDAFLLHTILLHLIGLSVAGFIAAVVILPERTPVWLIPLLMAIVTTGLLFVVRRGNTQLASVVLATALVIALTVSVYLQGTVRGYHLAGYTLILLITALLGSPRATLFFGSVIAAVLLGQFVGESTELFTRLPPPEAFLEIATLLVLLALIIVVLRVSVERLSNSLRRANTSEKRYRSLVEMSPDVIAVHSNQRLVYLNPAGLSLLGIENPEEILGRSVMDFVHPDYRELAQNRIRQSAGQQTPVDLIEQKFLLPDGRTLDVEVTSIAIEYQGQPAIQSVIRDISERKRTEAELETYRSGLEDLVQARTRELRERYDQLQQEIANRQQAERALRTKVTHLQSVAEVAPIVLWALDREGTFVLSEGRGLEKLGLRTGEVLGQSVFDVYRDFPSILADVRRTLTGEEVDAIYEIGDAVFDSRMIPLRDENGNVNGLVGASLSIGERVRAERAQQEIEERFKVAFHTSPDSVNINRLSDGMYLDINQGFTELTGYTADDVLGRTSLEIDIWADPTDRERLVEGLRASGEVRDLEAPFKLKDGSVRIGLMSARIIRVGDELCILSVTRDIHDRKLAEIELRQYREHLEELVEERTNELAAANRELVRLSRVKDEFVSNVSHELRTPVTSMNLYHRLIAKKPEQQDKYMVKLKREIDRLSILIEDLLRLSRLDQGRVEIRRQSIDLNELVSQYVEDRRLLASERGLSLVFHPGPESLLVSADQGLLSQTASILLTNALTYTPRGGTIVLRTCTREENHASWAGFSVEDDGPGISPRDREHLFKRFFRGAAATESGIQGTGLGLAIVKEIVELHQGTIEVESSGISGEGSVFRVWLPLDGT